MSASAIDNGGLTASTTFQLQVNPQPVAPSGFTLVGANTINCDVISVGARRLTFSPQYGGQNSQPISFSVVSEMLPTTAPGPYQLTLYTDNPRITFWAQQGAEVTTYRYDWLSACNAIGAPRQGVIESARRLSVNVLGNPVEGNQVLLEIRGVGGESVRLNLVDQHGRRLHQQLIPLAEDVESVRIPVTGSTSLLLLEVSTATQRQQLKLLKR